MQKFSIEFSPSAAKQFRKLSKAIQLRLTKSIDKLAYEPLPKNVKKLTSENDLYRIRVGDYRIIYQHNQTKLLILIVRVGHKKEIYNLL